MGKKTEQVFSNSQMEIYMMASGLKVSKMVEVPISMQLPESFIRDSGRKERKMARDCLNYLRKSTTMELSAKVSKKGLELRSSSMEINTKGSTEMVNSMVRESIHGPMGHAMRASLLRESDKDKVAGDQPKTMQTYT